MPLSSVAAFWAVSMLFVLTPGSDWAYAISSGLRNRSVVPAVSGLLSGHLAATVVVAAGLGLLLTGDPLILGVLTVVGALYIAWLGAGMLREPVGGAVDSSAAGVVASGVPGARPGAEPGAGPGARPGAISPAGLATGPGATSSRSQFARGVGVSLLNPKVILLLGALLPPFAAPEAALPMPAQMLLLGAVHLVGCAVVYFTVGLLAARVLSGRPSVAGWVTRLSGLALVCVAAGLLIRQVAGWL